MELIAKGVLKPLRRRSIRFSIDRRPKNSYQDVRDLTCISFVPALLPPNQTLYRATTQENNSLKRVTITDNTSQHQTIISSLNRKVDATSVCDRCRPVGATETPQESENSFNVRGKVVNKRYFQDHQVDEQAPKGENMTLIVDHKADLTLEGDVQYHNNPPPEMTLQQKTSEEDNNAPKRDKGTSPSPERHRNFKAPCGQGDEILKRGHNIHLTQIGEDEKNPYGNGDIILNRYKDSHFTPIRD